MLVRQLGSGTYCVDDIKRPRNTSETISQVAQAGAAVVSPTDRHRAKNLGERRRFATNKSQAGSSEHQQA
jgi:hypothetical protein